MKVLPESSFILALDAVDSNECLICGAEDIKWGSVPYHLVKYHNIYYTSPLGPGEDGVIQSQRVLR